MNRGNRLLGIAVLMAVAAGVWPVAAQSDDIAGATATLQSLESLLDWPAPDTNEPTDVRVMTRSALAFVPLPLIRLTSHDDLHVVAAVTEWQAPGADPPPAGRAFAFAHPPVACTDDHALCAGTPQVMRGAEVKAMWFALLIARSCNDRPPFDAAQGKPFDVAQGKPFDAAQGNRAVRSDAEDLFVRGRILGTPLVFSCRGPNPKGATPGDRQAAAVLRMAHRLLGR